MTLSTPSITNCNLTLTANPAVVTSLLESLDVNLKVFFNSLTSLTTQSGSFVPANNILNIAPSIPSELAPNFIILIVDNHVNLTIQSGEATLLSQNPVMKLYFNTMVSNNTYLISDIIIDGSTTAPVVMQQGVMVNWTLIYGTGIIS